MPIARRDLVKRVGRGVTAGWLAGLAGCPGVSSTRTDDGPNTRRDDGRSSYTSWVYDPRAVSETPHCSFFDLDLATVVAYRDAFREPTYAKYRNYVDLLDTASLNVDPEAIDRLLQVYPLASGPARSVALTGDYRPDRLRPGLDRTFAERAPYRGFDVFWNRDDGRVAVGVADGHVLLGYPTDTHAARDVVRALVDAKVGGVDRYVEASDAFETLAERLGSGDDASGVTHPPRTETAASRGVFENAVAKGHRYSFGRTTSRSRYVFVFATRADVDVAAVRSWIDANDAPTDRLFGSYTDVTVSGTGRAVVVDGTVPTEAI